MSSRISVCVRFRGEDKKKTSIPADRWILTENSVSSKDSVGNSNKIYEFDRVFTSENSTLDIFQDPQTNLRGLVRRTLEGYNATIFAYGQTASGKTYTMYGDGKTHGIIPYSIRELFMALNEVDTVGAEIVGGNTGGSKQEGKPFLPSASRKATGVTGGKHTLANTDKNLTPASDRHYLVTANYLEIYNEQLRDLLVEGEQEATALKVYDSSTAAGNPVEIRGLSETRIQTLGDVFECLNIGEKRRHVGETKMNARSSRSHTIFRINIQSRSGENPLENGNAMVNSGKSGNGSVSSNTNVSGSSGGKIFQSVLHLVDLAGSEALKRTNAVGERRVEGGNINKSLLTLGKVINQLVEAQNATWNTTTGDSNSNGGSNNPTLNHSASAPLFNTNNNFANGTNNNVPNNSFANGANNNSSNSVAIQNNESGYSSGSERPSNIINTGGLSGPPLLNTSLNTGIITGHHISFRESLLTRILQSSLGGNAHTCIIASVSGDYFNFAETKSTLEFASRAKCIKNVVKMNVVETESAKLRKAFNEILDLRKKLARYECNREVQQVLKQLEGSVPKILVTPIKDLTKTPLRINKDSKDQDSSESKKSGGVSGEKEGSSENVRFNPAAREKKSSLLSDITNTVNSKGDNSSRNSVRHRKSGLDTGLPKGSPLTPGGAITSAMTTSVGSKEYFASHNNAQVREENAHHIPPLPAHIQSELDSLRSQLFHAEENNTRMRKEMKGLKDQVIWFESVKKRLEESGAELEEQNERQKLQIHELTQDLSEARGFINDLTEDVKSKSERERLLNLSLNARSRARNNMLQQQQNLISNSQNNATSQSTLSESLMKKGANSLKRDSNRMDLSYGQSKLRKVDENSELKRDDYEDVANINPAVESSIEAQPRIQARIVELETENEKTLKSLEELSDDLKNLRVKKEKADKNVQELSNLLSGAEAKANRKTQECEKLKKDFEEYKKDANQWKRRWDDSKSRCVEIEEQKRLLEKQLQDYTEKEKLGAEILDEQKEKTNRLVQQNSQLTKEKASLIRQQEILESEKQNLIADQDRLIKEMEKEKEFLQKEKEELRQKALEEYEALKREAISEVEHLQTDAKDQHSKLKERLQKKMEEENSRLEEKSEREKDNLKEKMKREKDLLKQEMESKIAVLESNLKKTEDQSYDIKKQLCDEKRQFSEKEQRLKDEISQQKKEQEQKMNEEILLNKKLQSELKEEISHLKGDIAAFKDEISAKEKEVDGKGNEIRELEKELEIKTKDVVSLSQSLIEKDRSGDEKDDELQKLEEEIRKKREEIIACTEEISAKDEEIAAKIEEIKFLNTKMDSIMVEVEGIVEDAEAEKTKKHDEIKSLKEELKSLKEEFASTIDELKLTQTKLTSTQTELTSTQTKLSSAEDALDDQNAELGLIRMKSKNEKNEMSDIIRQLQHSIDTKSQELIQFETMIKKMEIDFKSKSEKFEAEIQDRETKLEEFAMRLDEERDKMKKKNELLVDETREKEREKEKKLENAYSEIENLKKLVDSTTLEKDEVNNALKRQLGDMESMYRKEIADLKKNHALQKENMIRGFENSNESLKVELKTKLKEEFQQKEISLKEGFQQKEISLKKELGILQKESDDLSKVAESMEQNTFQIKSERDQALAENSDLKSTLHEMKRTLQSKEDALVRNESLYIETQKSLSQQRDSQKVSDKENFNLKQEISTLYREIASLKSGAEFRNALIKKLEQEISNLNEMKTTLLEEKRLGYEDAKKIADSHREKKEEIENDLIDATGKISELEADIRLRDRKVETLEQEKKDLQIEYQDHKQESINLHEQYQKLNDEHRKLNHKYWKLKDSTININGVEESINGINNGMESKENKEGTGGNVVSTNIHSAKDKQIQNQKKEILKYENKIRDFELEIRNLSKKIASEETKKINKEKDFEKTLENEKKKWKKLLEQEQNKISIYENENGSWKTRFRKFEHEIRILKEANLKGVSLEKVIDLSSIPISLLENQRISTEKIDQKKEQLLDQKELEETKKELEDSNKKILIEKARREKLEMSFNNINHKLSLLETNLQGKSNELERTKEELLALEKKYGIIVEIKSGIVGSLESLEDGGSPIIMLKWGKPDQKGNYHIPKRDWEARERMLQSKELEIEEWRKRYEKESENYLKCKTENAQSELDRYRRQKAELTIEKYEAHVAEMEIKLASYEGKYANLWSSDERIKKGYASSKLNNASSSALNNASSSALNNASSSALNNASSSASSSGVSSSNPASSSGAFLNPDLVVGMSAEMGGNSNPDSFDSSLKNSLNNGGSANNEESLTDLRPRDRSFLADLENPTDPKIKRMNDYIEEREKELEERKKKQEEQASLSQIEKDRRRIEERRKHEQNRATNKPYWFRMQEAAKKR